jgi:uncharacterized protein YbaA (DUF1428 family)
MKTFKEYLAESKKVYSFKLKVAGELPEDFQDKLKAQLERVKIVTFNKIKTTPVQQLPLDFPELTNCEVHIFEIVCEYPITSPELVNNLKEIGMCETHFRVRGSGEPTEEEQAVADAEPSGEALLDDPAYKESGKVKVKDYFGDDFNKGFLKDLDKAAKARKKEEGQGEYKLPKVKQDKAGTMAPMSKISNPDPIKGKV